MQYIEDQDKQTGSIYIIDHYTDFGHMCPLSIEIGTIKNNGFIFTKENQNLSASGDFKIQFDPIRWKSAGPTTNIDALITRMIVASQCRSSRQRFEIGLCRGD
jgi:hypothetical protein